MKKKFYFFCNRFENDRFYERQLEWFLRIRNIFGRPTNGQASGLLSISKFCYDCLICSNGLERTFCTVWNRYEISHFVDRDCIKYILLESPIVVVLSGSMEPAFYRGDLLFLYHDRKVPKTIELKKIKPMLKIPRHRLRQVKLLYLKLKAVTFPLYIGS